MHKKKIGLGLIGCGTVGSGVLKILHNHASLIEQKIGAQCRIVKICDINIKKARARVALSRKIFTTNYKTLLHDPSIDIVIELIGGYEPAHRIISESLDYDKHIVTANKAVLSKYWDELFTHARSKKRLIYFEAAVGGGIPIVQALNEGLAANKIQKIMGILNATTNYILTKMSEEGMDYKRALVLAQKAGFAESDPSFDIRGLDATHKLSILASLALGCWVKPEDIYCEGITHVQIKDILFAKEQLGLSLKLIGIIKDHDGKTEVRVHPTLIPSTHPFSAVQNEYNAVLIHGDSVGDVMFYGKGAGRMAAASAVVSDIIFLARQVANGTAGQIPYVTYDRKKSISLLPMSEIRSRYYVRFTTVDRPGVLAQIAGILGKNNVSIASVYQKELPSSRRRVPILIVTHHAREGDMLHSIKVIDKLKIVRTKTHLLRIEE